MMERQRWSHGLNLRRGTALVVVGVFLAGLAAAATSGSAGPAPMSIREEGVPSLEFRVLWEGGLATTKETIDVYSWSWGFASTPVAPTGTGTKAGAPQVTELTLQRGFDEYSTFIARHGILGTHVSKVTLQGFAMDFETEKEVVYLEITMSNVLVTSYQSSGSDNGVPYESITLNFAKIEYKYTPQAKEPGTPPPMSWDVVKNKGT
jgi:type VI secretion system secreted protein Hcp